MIVVFLLCATAASFSCGQRTMGEEQSCQYDADCERGDRCDKDTWFCKPVAEMTLDPMFMRFGVVLQGTEVYKELKISNTGKLDLVVTGCRLEMRKITENDIRIVSGCAPFTLKNGETHAIGVLFVSKDERWGQGATLFLESNDDRYPVFMYGISGNGDF